MFLVENTTSTSFSIFWYDPDNVMGTLYPYGGNFSWYLNGTYCGSTEMRPGNNYCEPITFTGLAPGTQYTVETRAFAYDQYGEYGADLGSVSTVVSTLSRPAYFAWSVPKTQGGQYYIGADEWYDLMANIQLVHKHATGSYYTWNQTVPEAGEIITAARYNDCRAAIRSVPGYGTYIPQVASGEIVTAYQLNALVGELNAIP